MDDRDAGILLRVFIADLTAAVLRSVIHQKDLKIAVGLVDGRIQAIAQIDFHLINRYDDADERKLPVICLFSTVQIDHFTSPAFCCSDIVFP